VSGFCKSVHICLYHILMKIQRRMDMLNVSTCICTESITKRLTKLNNYHSKASLVYLGSVPHYSKQINHCWNLRRLQHRMCSNSVVDHNKQWCSYSLSSDLCPGIRNMQLMIIVFSSTYIISNLLWWGQKPKSSIARLHISNIYIL